MKAILLTDHQNNVSWGIAAMVSTIQLHNADMAQCYRDHKPARAKEIGALRDAEAVKLARALSYETVEVVYFNEGGN